jgi:hypothetical protein
MLPDGGPIGVDQCNCFAMRKAARQISRFYDACLEPTGLRITQFLILAALRQQQNVAVNALAERLDIERTAMGKMTAEAASSSSPPRGRICSNRRRLCGVTRKGASTR